MTDYSIELSSRKIDDTRTKELFREVRGCYSNGSCRSAVVSLWSVVVADLYFKIEIVALLYGDKAAADLIQKIAEKRQSNPKSPEWEEMLLEEVYKRTELLDVGEYTGLSSIQKYRNLCAHPVFGTSETLFTPDADLTRSLIRTALDSLLTKPALLNRNVFDTLIEDIADNAEVLDSEDALERYLIPKYLGRVSGSGLNALFRSFWKIVFRDDSEKATQNRIVNFRTLKILYKLREAECANLISGEPNYFGDVVLRTGRKDAFIAFLNGFPNVFNLLGEAVHIQIDGACKNERRLQYMAHFRSTDAKSHIDVIAADLGENGTLPDAETLGVLLRYTRGTPEERIVLRFAVNDYVRSGSYNTADERFRTLIRPHISRFQPDELEYLLNGIESNTQVYRRGAADDHRLVRDRIVEVAPDLSDTARFPMFWGSIGETT